MPTRRPSSASCCRSSPRTPSARSSSRSSSARATRASARATSRPCSNPSNATRCAAACCKASTESQMSLQYLSGFGNEFATEALPGALPVGQNSPQKAPYGLYAEQLSGTAFTAPRSENRRSWLYRIMPSAKHGAFTAFDQPRFHNDFGDGPVTPEQLRWSPSPVPAKATDFIDSLFTMAGNGGAAHGQGIGIHLYAANCSMHGRFFYDADGELLIVPQHGRLTIATEFGVLELEPQEIAVIPRGVRFRVDLVDGEATGYVCENFGAAMRLPDLGPIGSNGLANPRDFLVPNAAYEDIEGEFELVAKFQGHL